MSIVVCCQINTEEFEFIPVYRKIFHSLGTFDHELFFQSKTAGFSGSKGVKYILEIRCGLIHIGK